MAGDIPRLSGFFLRRAKPLIRRFHRLTQIIKTSCPQITQIAPCGDTDYQRVFCTEICVNLCNLRIRRFSRGEICGQEVLNLWMARACTRTTRICTRTLRICTNPAWICTRTARSCTRAACSVLRTRRAGPRQSTQRPRLNHGLIKGSTDYTD
jgi:hypothetical protein